MNKYHIEPSDMSPEILLDPDNNTFIIRGTSGPEDVRGIYFPVIKWLTDFRTHILSAANSDFTEEKPFIMQFDLSYFNSSSAKFLYDIVHELRSMKESGIPVAVTWHYDEEDTDMMEAGEDLSYLAEFEFVYLKKQ